MSSTTSIVGVQSTAENSKTMMVRLAFLLFSSLVVILGLLLVDVPFAHPTLGVRTEQTASNPHIWAAINQATGALLIVWGLLCTTILSCAKLNLQSLIGSTTITVLIAVSSLISPSTVLSLGEALTHAGYFQYKPAANFISLIMALSAFAVIGSCICGFDTKSAPQWLGFRFLPMEFRNQANRVGGRTLHLSSGICLVLAIYLYACGRPHAANVVLAISLLAIPLLATGIVLIAQSSHPRSS
jgi:hypothetical protein